ncbi:DUF481 domain-containing protein [Mucilaginibacter sp. X4EP1]|uniref:DUF481 domain-containing protein n=1 Tax=Mucilaginibacter sp. X4EP1 TaxID=2723092 RepID=UPI002169D372|nr:DUF481 domain-containing protein [Mucilaginibacter sp. X4EP1]MCS3813714.1 hypothetical protein [Mucilaginibacter sp. X4EP1]
MLPKYIVKSVVLVLLFTFIAGRGYAQKLRDTLFFSNGEVLVGELKQMVEGRVSFDSDGMSLLTIKAYKLKGMHTTISTLRIQTTDRQWLYGKLESANSQDSIYFNDGTQRKKLAWNQISSITPFRKRFFDQLSGKVSVGFSFSHSSSIGQVNLNGNVSYVTKWLQTELTVSELGSIDSSGFTRDQETIQLASFHYIGNTTWLVAGLVSYQRNQELSLDHRYQASIAGGNKIISETYLDLLVLSGLSTNQEQSVDGLSSGLLVEIPLIVRLDYFKFQHPDLQISMSNAAYISLSQAGRYRYDGSIDFSWELVKDFYYTINLTSDYDSKPADTGSAKVDYGIVMGISYKF